MRPISQMSSCPVFSYWIEGWYARGNDWNVGAGAVSCGGTKGPSKTIKTPAEVSPP